MKNKKSDEDRLHFLHKAQHSMLDADPVFHANEVAANMLVAKCLVYCSGILLASWLLDTLGIFALEEVPMGRASFIGAIELLIPAVICNKFNGEKPWIKYMMFICLAIVTCRIDALLTYNVVILMVLPVVLSVRYSKASFTAYMGVITLILFALSAYFGTKSGVLDLNFYDLPDGTVLVVEGGLANTVLNLGPLDTKLHVYEVMVQYFIPKALIYTLVCFICVEVAKNCYKLVIDKDNSIKEKSRIETELSYANSIQLSLLPKIHEIFKTRKDFEIYASMLPAKEVGGDLYDAFLIDDTHLVIIVADVSGKGVPAALFMVTAKTLIKDQAMQGISAGGVFTKVNRILCENNEENLFVTAWMGIVDLQTGGVDFCNAGHNKPIVKNGDNGYDYLQSPSGLVLAAIDGYKYKSRHLTLHPGDVIYLYTDGITEATNEDNELYGDDRLLELIRKHGEDTTADMCQEVSKEVKEFAGTVPQFDDQTMLAIRFNGGIMVDSIEVEARVEEIPRITEFIDSKLEAMDCPMPVQVAMDVAIDEIASNISYYAYKDEIGYMRIRIEEITEPHGVQLTFEDGGVPYNPLIKEDPDVTLGLEERSIGGLGIFMVKKSMDSMEYRQHGGKNILTLTKNF